jgi:diketogulonate reductase-like aldo/keto reductase
MLSSERLSRVAPDVQSGMDGMVAMTEHRFGPAGTLVPTIGQGTWKLDADDRRAAVRALRRGLDLGMRHVDTAEMYGDAEPIVAEAIAGRRDEVFLVSKVLPQNATRLGTVQACERSLMRLKTDRLDCFLLHWPSSHPLAETIAGLAELKHAGKIRSFGVSNFDEDLLADAVQLAGKDHIACNQVQYHLEDRAIEAAVIPYCEQHGISVVGYSPFGSGRFPRHKVLDDVAHAHGATPFQVALAFLTRRQSLFAIPKASRVDHVEDNFAASKLSLTPDEIDRIDAAFPA